MDDLISRQDAIDALEEQLDCLQMLNKNENPKAESKWYGVNWARNTIADLPSAQQWIPCSENLPEWGEEVLVQIENEDIFIMSLHIKEYGEDSYLVYWKTAEESVEWEANEVVAWMPLPEPWKGENNENIY